MLVSLPVLVLVHISIQFRLPPLHIQLIPRLKVEPVFLAGIPLPHRVAHRLLEPGTVLLPVDGPHTALVQNPFVREILPLGMLVRVMVVYVYVFSFLLLNSLSIYLSVLSVLTGSIQLLGAAAGT